MNKQTTDKKRVVVMVPPAVSKRVDKLAKEGDLTKTALFCNLVNDAYKRAQEEKKAKRANGNGNGNGKAAPKTKAKRTPRKKATPATTATV